MWNRLERFSRVLSVFSRHRLSFTSLAGLRALRVSSAMPSGWVSPVDGPALSAAGFRGPTSASPPYREASEMVRLRQMRSSRFGYVSDSSYPQANTPPVGAGRPALVQLFALAVSARPYRWVVLSRAMVGVRSHTRLSVFEYSTVQAPQVGTRHAPCGSHAQRI